MVKPQNKRKKPVKRKRKQAPAHPAARPRRPANPSTRPELRAFRSEVAQLKTRAPKTVARFQWPAEPRPPDERLADPEPPQPPPEVAPEQPPELHETPELDARERALERAEQLRKARKRAQFAGAAVMLVGLAFSVWTGGNIARDRAALAWPEVVGKVTVSQKSLVSRNPDRYQTHFVYEYRAQDGWHTSRRVRFAGGQGAPTDEHRTGDKVKVRYDPNEPAMAVLQPGVTRWAWIQLMFGVVVTGLGGTYIAMSFRGKWV